MLGSPVRRVLALCAAGLGATSIGLLLYRAWSRGRCGPPLPPGPRGWPLLGCVDLLSPDLYLKLTEMGKEYGDVFSFYIGNRLTVVLNSACAIRAAFVQQPVTFAGRPRPWVMELVGVQEVINNGTYSEEWKEERKFLLSAMRHFGYGSASLDEKICTEVDRLLDEYDACAQTQRPLDPRYHLPKATANLIFSILIDEQFDYDDPRLATRLELVACWQERVGEANLLDFFPWLRYFPWRALQRLRHVRSEIVPIYEKHVTDHKASFDPARSRGVLDVYLKDRGVHFEDDRLVGLFFSLVGDTVDSLPEAMVWMVLYICSDLDLQRELQEEVDAVTQGGRAVMLADRPRMPLIQAAVMETLRLCAFVPISEPHCPLRETTLLGYHIPQDCNVIANLYAAHMDPREWKNPTSFQPRRFLGADGRLLKPDAFLPYSAGRRTCLGEHLANKVMQLFLARLVATYSVTYSDVPPGLQPQRWFVRKARPFCVYVSRRR